MRAGHDLRDKYIWASGAVYGPCGAWVPVPAALQLCNVQAAPLLTPRFVIEVLRVLYTEAAAFENVFILVVFLR